jgi:CRISPR/Cas system CSM-associated protein Csm2 small subunit
MDGLVYLILPTLYKVQLLFRVEWYERMAMFGKFKIIGEAVVAYFKLLSRYSPGGTE